MGRGLHSVSSERPGRLGRGGRGDVWIRKWWGSGGANRVHPAHTPQPLERQMPNPGEPVSPKPRPSLGELGESAQISSTKSTGLISFSQSSQDLSYSHPSESHLFAAHRSILFQRRAL